MSFLISRSNLPQTWSWFNYYVTNKNSVWAILYTLCTDLSILSAENPRNKVEHIQKLTLQQHKVLICVNHNQQAEILDNNNANFMVMHTFISNSRSSSQNKFLYRGWNLHFFFLLFTPLILLHHIFDLIYYLGISSLR